MITAVLLVAQVASAAEPMAQTPRSVGESQMKDYWTRAKNAGNAPALYPKSAIRAAASGCVAVAYTIDAEGKPGSAHVLKSYISRQDADEMRSDFEKSVLANLLYWRFLPAAGNQKREPISTYSTITVVAELGLHNKAFQAEIGAHCKVDGDSPGEAAGKPAEART